MNILGKQVTLRAIEETELPILHNWANDPEIWNMAAGWHFPSSMAFMKKWFDALQNDNINIKLAIQTPDDGLVGTINMTNIDWKNNHASIGIMIGDKMTRGKGYGTDAIMALERYAFEELHFERLDGDIIEYNKISLNATIKCGWKEEGRRRNWFFKKNRYWDSISIGITRQDYFDLVKLNHYWE